jgi:hypothetical protein
MATTSAKIATGLPERHHLRAAPNAAGRATGTILTTTTTTTDFGLWWPIACRFPADASAGELFGSGGHVRASAAAPRLVEPKNALRFRASSQMATVRKCGITWVFA